MTNTPVHIKFEYKEMLLGKKEILSNKIAVKKVLAIIKRYYKLRKIELSLKNKINKKIKELKTNIEKIEKKMPKPKMPKSMKKNDYEYKRKEVVEHIHEIKKDDDDLEKQLADIQARLKQL